MEVPQAIWKVRSNQGQHVYQKIAGSNLLKPDSGAVMLAFERFSGYFPAIILDRKLACGVVVSCGSSSFDGTEDRSRIPPPKFFHWPYRSRSLRVTFIWILELEGKASLTNLLRRKEDLAANLSIALSDARDQLQNDPRSYERSIDVVPTRSLGDRYWDLKGTGHIYIKHTILANQRQ